MRHGFLSSLLLLAAVCPAGAQAVHGFYLQGNAGIIIQRTQPLDATLAPPAEVAPGPGAAEQAGAAIGGPPAATESGSLGYGFGQGLRVEVQGLHTATAASSD